MCAEFTVHFYTKDDEQQCLYLDTATSAAGASVADEGVVLTTVDCTWDMEEAAEDMDVESGRDWSSEPRSTLSTFKLLVLADGCSLLVLLPVLLLLLSGTVLSSPTTGNEKIQYYIIWGENHVKCEWQKQETMLQDDMFETELGLLPAYQKLSRVTNIL